MKHVLLLAALFALSANAASAAPLTIEPSEAYSEAVKVAFDAAVAQIGVEGLEKNNVELRRAKNEAGRFGDYKIEMTVDKFGGFREQSCRVSVMISRDIIAKRPDGVIVLETDTEANLQTVASNIHARCEETVPRRN